MRNSLLTISFPFKYYIKYVIFYIMTKEKKKNLIEKIVILSLMVVVIGVLVFFLKDIFFPLVKLEINNDKDAAKALLESKGFLGYMTISLVEALQMVVIFIPAEFIQLTSGMTYPWYLALILCDIGVALGASIIYFIVHVFKFNGDIFHKTNKIEKYERMAKTRNTMIFMYILFIMPIIPFGAICYYGSNKKLPYLKYLLTCTTGVIPSILTSIVMGTAIKEFITNALPLWLLILIIIGAAAILFMLLAFVLNKFFFKENRGTAGSFMNNFLYNLLNKFLRLKNKVVVIDEYNVKDIKGPYLALSNHHSFYDFNYLKSIDKERGASAVVNAYYFRQPVIGKLFKNSGFIPKKMFTSDLKTVKGILKAKKDGYPIHIFPEARLSTSGASSFIDSSSAALAKKLDIPLVLVNIKKAYFYHNKWRKKGYRGTVEVEVKRVIYPDELKTLSVEELHNIISSTILINEFDYTDSINIKSKNKALGLENILYRCPDCGSMYSNETKGNTLYCTNCHKEYHILPNYHFDDEKIDNISAYYENIKQYEKDNIDNINFDIEVDTKIFKDGVKKTVIDTGLFHLDKEKLYYKSSINDELYFEYKVEQLEGIAYSVNEEFEMYHNGDLYYFYPKENKKICTRIALVYEILKELEWEKKHQIKKEN